MKRLLKCCLFLFLINHFCLAQAKIEVNTKQQLETIRAKLRKDNLDAASGSAMVYEFSRSKDDAKYMAEIFKNKKGDQSLMILWMKGIKEKTYIYLDLNKSSRMMILSDEAKSGFEMTELTNIIEVLSPLRDLVKALNKEKVDPAEEVKFYPQVYLHLNGTGITSSLGMMSDRCLSWEALDEDVSGINIKEDYYKILREKHGGYFTLDKKTGVILEQKETRDGQTRTMKLISNKPWNGKTEDLLPNIADYKIDRKELNDAMIDKMTGGMLTDMLEKMIADKEFVNAISKKSNKLNHKLKALYTAMWRSNPNLVALPMGWSMKQKKFTTATEQWSPAEKQAWKKKPKQEATQELREKYFPELNALAMELMFEGVASELKLDAAGKQRKNIVLEAITRALYQAWADVQIENTMKSL